MSAASQTGGVALHPPLGGAAIPDATSANGKQEEPQQTVRCMSMCRSDDDAEHVILCFTPLVDSCGDHSLRRRVVLATSRLLCWALPTRPLSRAERLLRAHLVYSCVQAAAIAAVVCYDFSRSRLLFFGVIPCLCASFLRSAIKDLDNSRRVSELLRIQRDVKFKVCGLAAVAAVAPVWWGMEIIFTVAFHVHDVTIEALVAACVCLHYSLIFIHFVFMAHMCGRRLVQNVLPCTKALATRYSCSREDHASCSICLAEYEAHESVIRLSCGHMFHASCISTWVQRSDMCPMRCESAVLRLPEDVKCRSFGRWASKTSAAEALPCDARRTEVRRECGAMAEASARSAGLPAEEAVRQAAKTEDHGLEVQRAASDAEPQVRM